MRKPGADCDAAVSVEVEPRVSTGTLPFHSAEGCSATSACWSASVDSAVYTRYRNSPSAWIAIPRFVLRAVVPTLAPGSRVQARLGLATILGGDTESSTVPIV